jgi:hypothetical protein
MDDLLHFSLKFNAYQPMNALRTYKTLSLSVQGAIKKTTINWVAYKHQKFLIVLKARMFKIMVPADFVSGETHFLTYR